MGVSSVACSLRSPLSRFSPDKPGDRGKLRSHAPGPSGGPMTTTESVEKKERWSFSWKHLYDEVVTTGLCTGCAGGVIACPHDVLDYDDLLGVYKPVQTETDYGGPADCSHGDKACKSCTRPFPLFRAWEPEIDDFLFGRTRTVEEISGVSKDIVLARASDPELHEVGQDG